MSSEYAKCRGYLIKAVAIILYHNCENKNSNKYAFICSLGK